jgi:outer membrane receptor protein involved in Fe transport
MGMAQCLYAQEPPAAELKTVTVPGKKPVFEKTPGKIVYNLANSVTAAGSDLLQAIGLMPGVKLQQNEISIAGKGAVKVMINNRLVQLSGQDLLRYLQSFSANQVSKIELITNPSASFDAEGNAGLINIITKHSRLPGYTGNIQVASKYYLPGQSSVYGIRSFGELNGSSNLFYNKGRWSAFGNLNLVRDRHLEGFGTDIFYPNQTWLQTDTGLYINRNLNGMLGIDYKLNAGTTVGVSYAGGKNIYDGADHVNNPVKNLSGGLDSTIRTFATYYPVALSAAFNIHADIHLDTSGKQLLLNADYFNYYRTDRSDFESYTYNADGSIKSGSQTRYFDDNKQNIMLYTLKADMELPTPFAKYSIGAKLSFISNYSNAFYYDKLPGTDSLQYNTSLSNAFNYTENTQAVYAGMLKEARKWKLEAGLRAEQTQTKGYSYTLDQTVSTNILRLFPSATIQYKNNGEHSFQLSVRRRINRPSFWNLNPYKSLYSAYSYGEGNPYLQPEYNTNYEFSHAYKGIISSSLFFYKTSNGFNNVTIADTAISLVYTKPLNFIRTNRFGLSENISFKPLAWWESNTLISLYYTNAHSVIANIRSIRGFGYYLSSANNFYFDLHKTLAAAVNFWYQFPEVDHIGRSGKYYRLDLGFKATLPGNKLNIALLMNDIFRSSASSVKTTVNGIKQQLTNFQFNRFIQLSLSYRFGKKNEDAGARSTGNEEERGRIH